MIREYLCRFLFSYHWNYCERSSCRRCRLPCIESISKDGANTFTLLLHPYVYESIADLC